MGRHRSPGPPRGFHPGPRARSISPGRRRSPPRRLSREREMPSLASRIRGRSASREREARRLAPRSSRSRSPGRGRMQRGGTPPPPRGPRVGGPPEGPRGGVLRSPVVFPKVEPDVPMRDVTRPGVYRREDSVASSHHPAQQNTPTRAPANHAPVQTPLTYPAQPQPVNAASAAAPAAAQPDAIKTLLESSAQQWQQISSAVAAASSVTPARPKTTPPSSDTNTDDKGKLWSNRIE